MEARSGFTGVDAAAVARVIAEETMRDVAAPVVAMRDEILRRHADGVAAILFYGSCLRRADPAEGVLDFYVLVDDYARFYRRLLPALANRLLPPNVFYAERPWDGRTLRAKYAVVSLRQFEDGTARRSLQSSLWARFAQPARIVHARDAAAAAAVQAALAEAIVAMVEAAVPLVPTRFAADALWQTGFRATYGAELRSEGPERAEELFRADRARYESLAAPALALAGADGGFRVERAADGTADFIVAMAPAARRRGLWRWRVRRPLGKLLNLLRLVKGGFTFQGGLDYVLWKVERHSGVRVPVSPWQRRHPLLGAPLIAWRLYRRGGFR